jgi:uncharacterized protein YukE
MTDKANAHIGTSIEDYLATLPPDQRREIEEGGMAMAIQHLHGEIERLRAECDEYRERWQRSTAVVGRVCGRANEYREAMKKIAEIADATLPATGNATEES